MAARKARVVIVTLPIASFSNQLQVVKSLKPLPVSFGPNYSKCGRVRFRQLTPVPLRGAFQRLQRVCLVDVNHDVELRRQSYFEVMTETLGLWSVNHADGALQSFPLQQLVRAAALAQINPETRPILSPQLIDE